MSVVLRTGAYLMAERRGGRLRAVHATRKAKVNIAILAHGAASKVNAFNARKLGARAGDNKQRRSSVADRKAL
jgi:hypothetical protein